MKIELEKIDFELSKIIIYPKIGTTSSDRPIEVSIDPPINADMALSLLEADEVQVEDGKLLGFQCLSDKFVTLKIYQSCKIRDGKWVT